MFFTSGSCLSLVEENIVNKQTNKQNKQKKKNGRDLNDLVFYQAYAQNICISF